MRVEVLRVGHRPQRDKRITTHVCLTARAMGARRAHLAEVDPDVAASVADVAARFGGAFVLEDGTGWRAPVKAWQAQGGQVVHLTMYGRPLHEALPDVLARGTDVLVVVGAEKVPGDLYRLADENVAVGNQPHSEVAALAVFLDRLGGGKWEHDRFDGGRMQIRPSARGKDVLHRDP